MKLTDKHIEAIKEFVSTNHVTNSWTKVFGVKNIRSDAVTASKFFRRPEVAKMIEALTEARDKAAIKATEDTYTKLYSEKIASDLELDVLHTQILRGEAEMEEVFAVREKRLVPVPSVKQTDKEKWILEEQVVFKRVKRKASIKEIQMSIHALYMRRGSYKGVVRVKVEQDDAEAALNAKNGNGNVVERVVVLSNGIKIPII